MKKDVHKSLQLLYDTNPIIRMHWHNSPMCRERFKNIHYEHSHLEGTVYRCACGWEYKPRLSLDADAMPSSDFIMEYVRESVDNYLKRPHLSLVGPPPHMEIEYD